MTNDFIQRFLFDNYNIRGEFVRLEKSYQAIIEQHNYPPVISELVGQSLMTAVLLTETMKFNGQMTLQLQSDGPVSLLVAQCNHKRHIRALAKWRKDVEPINIKSALGKGNIMITVEYDDKVNPYQSIIPLEHKNVSDAVANYFICSEQLPTKFVLACDNNNAAGIMLQVMPGDVDNDLWHEITALANTLTQSELLDLGVETILQRLFHEHDVRLFDKEEVTFRCKCTIQRMERAIITIGEEEANDILKTSKEIMITCDFCNSQFGFNKNQVTEIFSRS